MASDVKVTAANNILMLTSRALSTPSQVFELPRATVEWMDAYIRKAAPILGDECACGHFEVEHQRANHKGQSLCCGCERFTPAAVAEEGL